MKLKAPIQTARLEYKPFKYPKYFEFYSQSLSSVWRAETVDMESDIKDYMLKSSDDEKAIIADILKGFTMMETLVGDYWRDKVCKMFPHYEIIAAATSNSFFEQIHIAAYAYLNDSLGLTDYKAFLNDKPTKNKLDFYVEHKNDLVSLATFSGIGEGVSLFSAFSILLSLSRNGRYKGLAQIISWSARDEYQHSEMGCMLFKDLVKEIGITEEEQQQIYNGFDAGLETEFNFIDNLFSGRKLDNITKDELKDYMYVRANNRLEALGLEAKYKVSGVSDNLREWFSLETQGQSSNDFFWQSLDGGNYTALLSQNFEDFDYSKINVEWND